MNLADELQKLQQLHQSGAINDEEFARAKARLLDGASNDELGYAACSTPHKLSAGEVEEQTRQWAMFLHLSILTSFLVPLAGVVAPILIWQLKKTELPGLDFHGKNAANWIISMVIYFVVCFALAFALVGIPLMIGWMAVGIIFPIIAGVKASNGEVWKYPLAITFLK